MREGLRNSPNGTPRFLELLLAELELLTADNRHGSLFLRLDSPADSSGLVSCT
ncbi:hypothetical protein ACFPRL_31235 [Pseudoclavibacter helvolus]